MAGPLIEAHEGTLVQFLGDGLMVVFNAPFRCPDPAVRQLLANALRDGFGPAVARWQRREAPLGIGIGIAHGSATVGQIGFEGRLDYAAIGRVTNLAARLCSEAADGQILVSEEVHAAISGWLPAVSLGAMRLKGFAEPVSTYDFGPR